MGTLTQLCRNRKNLFHLLGKKIYSNAEFTSKKKQQMTVNCGGFVGGNETLKVFNPSICCKHATINGFL